MLERYRELFIYILKFFSEYNIIFIVSINLSVCSYFSCTIDMPFFLLRGARNKQNKKGEERIAYSIGSVDLNPIPSQFDSIVFLMSGPIRQPAVGAIIVNILN